MDGADERPAPEARLTLRPWEGFAIEQILAATGEGEAYFWGTHAGAELDLLLLRRGRRIGVEVKYADAPSMTRSLHVALGDPSLALAFIVYPGQERYRLHPKVEVVPLAEAQELLAG